VKEFENYEQEDMQTEIFPERLWELLTKYVDEKNPIYPQRNDDGKNDFASGGEKKEMTRVEEKTLDEALSQMHFGENAFNTTGNSEQNEGGPTNEVDLGPYQDDHEGFGDLGFGDLGEIPD